MLWINKLLASLDRSIAEVHQKNLDKLKRKVEEAQTLYMKEGDGQKRQLILDSINEMQDRIRHMERPEAGMQSC